MADMKLKEQTEEMTAEFSSLINRDKKFSWDGSP